MKNFNKSSYYNKESSEAKYIFETFFDKIRNIEVKPGVIQFIGGNIEKEKEKEKDNITGLQGSNLGRNPNLNNIINNTSINDINNNNKSKRKISEEKKITNFKKMFSLSDRSIKVF